MFMMLSSWQSHCESSLGSFDECRIFCVTVEHLYVDVCSLSFIRRTLLTFALCRRKSVRLSVVCEVFSTVVSTYFCLFC